ncbi:hypothetical protein DPMN_034145 [Dreissena polymorpha]|uniref:G-protein coupled receptors family 1 profile domain-containing protein n=1 Tax=Dreissena polymorpha TaxID=45954 RepID=A0A9D4M4X8_DREPO|nr:hypothetical protein DPMN_034145 [Dreissena polymorpha]
MGTYVAISVVCLLMAAFIISLNGLVIFIIARQKDNNRLHFFMLHLARAAIYLDHAAAFVWNHLRNTKNLTEITEMNPMLTESTFPLRHKSMNEGLLPKIKTIKMTLIICLSLFICWLPASVFNTMDLYGINELDHRYYKVLQRLHALNSACNLMIFLLFSKHHAGRLRLQNYTSYLSEMSVTWPCKGGVAGLATWAVLPSSRGVNAGLILAERG